MSRFIFPAAILLFLAYLAISSYERSQEREIEEQRIAQEREIARQNINSLIARYGAKDNWQAELAGDERFRLSPILTIELENLWLGNEPIAFPGELLDIATHSESEYLVSIALSLYGSIDYMFSTDLQLSLVASKSDLDQFLENHPELLQSLGLSDGILAIAKINSITTEYILGETGERQEVRIGQGELLDLIFTGRHFL